MWSVRCFPQPRVHLITSNSPAGPCLIGGLSLGHRQRKELGRARVTWRKEAFRQPQWRLLEDEIREQRTAIQGTALLCSRCTQGLRCRRPRSLQASEVPGHLGCPGLNSWTCRLYSISRDKIPPRLAGEDAWTHQGRLVQVSRALLGEGGGCGCSQGPQAGVDGWARSGRKLVVGLAFLLIKGLHA